jgi:hypothetical protein
MRFRLFTAAVATLFAPLGHTAASLTGLIQTLHINLQTNYAHVQFVGAPTIYEAGCPSVWTANSLDEEKFMKHVWPLLIAAKASGVQVTITTSDCVNGYPRIVTIDIEPRIL